MSLIWDEQLADALDDGNARRGWWLDLRRENDEKSIEWEVLRQTIEAARDFEIPNVAVGT